MGITASEAGLDHWRLKEFVKEFIGKYQYLYEKRIQKLVFYGEIYCLINFERRLTEATFVPYMYGSFSEDIRKALEDLEAENEVPTKTDLVRGKEVTKYIGDVSGGNLDNRAKAVVDRIHKKTRNQSTEELAQCSKQNWLFEETDYGESMNFAKFLKELEQCSENREEFEGLEENLTDNAKAQIQPALTEA
jgi:uncharacterized phage-associated protein